MVTPSIKINRSWYSLVCYRAEYDNDAMRKFFDEPDEVLRTACGPIYKATFEDTSTVAVVEVAGQKFIVKRYNLKNVFHRLKRSIFTSKAMVSWRSGLKLWELGIPSISPVAVIERRFGFLKGTAYLITEFSDGMLGRDYFSVDSPHKQHWPETMKRVANIAAQLKQAHLVHDDFQFGNMVIVDHQPYLLDLDHMKQYKTSDSRFLKHHQRDLQHFNRFLEVSPEAKRLFEQVVRV